MHQFTTNLLDLLVTCFDTSLVTLQAARFVDNALSFMPSEGIKEEFWQAREQAYNGLNAEIGDYVKEVQIQWMTILMERQQEQARQQLVALQVEIDRLK